MEVLATISRRGKYGERFVWEFCRDERGYFATNGDEKHIRCYDAADARRFYKRMIGYGFTPQTA